MLIAFTVAAIGILAWLLTRTSTVRVLSRSPVAERVFTATPGGDGEAPAPAGRDLEAPFGGLYESVFKSIADALIVINDQGQIRSFSPSAERIFGYRAGEVIGRNVSVLMPVSERDQHDEYVRKYVESGWASGRVETLLLSGDAHIIRPEREIVAVRKNGAAFPARLIVSEVETAGRRWFVGLISDVSERKRLEQKVADQVEAQATLLRQLREAYAVIEKQKQRMQYELDVGREIQLSMVPHQFPMVPEFDLWATLRPAREVGGDFYDFLTMPAGQLWVWVGDVSGKGVPAALLMAVTKTLIRSAVSRGAAPAEVLTAINAELARDNDNSMFVTAFLACLDIGTGSLRYVNAGHNPPLIQRGATNTERLDRRHGPPLGAVEGAVYTQSDSHLSVDDVLLLYTDGVTEAWDAAEQLFAESRLRDVLLQGRRLPSQQLTEAVVSSVQSFSSGVDQADDITVLVLRYNGRTAGSSSRSIPFRVPARIDALREALDEVERAVAALGGDDAAQQRFGMAFDELLGNILHHGDAAAGTIDCELRREDGAIQAVIEDDGPAFNPMLLPPPDTSQPLELREIGGLGVYLVRGLFDDVRYERRNGRNVLTIIQRHLDRKNAPRDSA